MTRERKTSAGAEDNKRPSFLRLFCAFFHAPAGAAVEPPGGMELKNNGERETNMLLHLCRCGRPIPQGVSLCENCQKTHGSRHMIYNQQARSKASAAFYVSRAWRIMRARVCEVFNGVDIVAFYEDGVLLPAEEVHHIVELEDDWDASLDPLNLIPLNGATHKRITAAYKRSPASMAACQKRLIEYRKRWFEGAGGVQKVFAAAGLVAPPSSVEKSPH